MINYFEEKKTQKNDQEVSRILTAAVISPKFRQMLLANPEKAIANGFGGERFSLPQADETRMKSIRAANLADFASQLRSQELTYPGFSPLAAD